MADDLDLAAERQQELTADALAEWRRRQGPALSPQASARWCEYCDEEIPEERRTAVPGCVRCVDCQEEAERVPG